MEDILVKSYVDYSYSISVYSEDGSGELQKWWYNFVLSDSLHGYDELDTYGAVYNKGRVYFKTDAAGLYFY